MRSALCGQCVNAFVRRGLVAPRCGRSSRARSSATAPGWGTTLALGALLGGAGHLLGGLPLRGALHVFVFLFLLLGALGAEGLVRVPYGRPESAQQLALLLLVLAPLHLPAAQPAPPPGAPSRRRADGAQGTLKDFGIADILQLIGQQQKTGTLHLQSKEQEVHVTFRDGIVRAESSTRRKKELIGNMLVRAELISESQLESALEIQRRTLKRLGDVLVSERILRRALPADDAAAGHRDPVPPSPGRTAPTLPRAR